MKHPAPLPARLATLLHPVTHMIRLPQSPRLATSLHRFTYLSPPLHVRDNRASFYLRWRDHGVSGASCDPPRRSRRQRRTRQIKRLAVSGLAAVTLVALVLGFRTQPVVTSALFLISSTLFRVALAVRQTIKDDPGVQNLENDNL